MATEFTVILPDAPGSLARRPWAHMPKPQLTYPEIEALADYLASLTR